MHSFHHLCWAFRWKSGEGGLEKAEGMFLIAASGGGGLHTVSEFCCTSQILGHATCVRDTGPRTWKGPTLGLMPCGCHLNISSHSGQGTPPPTHTRFHFSLGPANHIALSVCAQNQGSRTQEVAGTQRSRAPSCRGARPGQSYCHEAWIPRLGQRKPSFAPPVCPFLCAPQMLGWDAGDSCQL